MKIGVPHKPLIYKEKLFSGRFFGILGFSNKAGYIDQVCFGIDSYKLLIDVFAEYMDNALALIGGWQMQYFSAVVL